MSIEPLPRNTRILVIDDNTAIHSDFRKILAARPSTAGDLAKAEAELFGTESAPDKALAFEVTSASQGQEGCRLAQEARQRGEPFAVAFVDIRMPPGWDGIETTQRLWREDLDLQVVLCTAHSDYSLEDVVQRLGRSDRLLILKKPFDNIEVAQLANALTEKWRLTREARLRMDDLEKSVEARTAELHASNEALRAQSERAAELASEAVAGSRAKSEFLAMMSHEIRTPMHGIISLIDLLMQTKLEGDQREFAETVSKSAESLLEILDSILDFSRMEAGKLSIETAPFEVRQMAAGAVDVLRERARRKGLQLAWSMAPDLPDHLVGDSHRLRQILLNLVSNAIKFTARGRVQVELSCRSQSADAVELQCSVRDSGIGLSEAARQKLFEPFTQADSSTTRKFGGTGLGLAICRRLVELMGGEIGVSSVEGQGSTFWFTVQLEKLPQAPVPISCRTEAESHAPASVSIFPAASAAPAL